MNIIESWKKQITFLQNKDFRPVFFITLKRYKYVLLSTPITCILLMLLSIKTYFLFSYQNQNLTTLSKIGVTKIVLSILFLSIVLFLRPSTKKKDKAYLFSIITKKFLLISLFSFLSFAFSTTLLFPFLIIASTYILLSIDGEYKIKNTISNYKKGGLFLLYNLPILTILSCITVVSLIFFQYFIALFMQNSLLQTIGLFLSSLVFSFVLLCTIFTFVFTYTFSAYENNQFFFDS